MEALPPHKRFSRLLQKQHNQHQDDKENAVISKQLPAKKRKESRDTLSTRPPMIATAAVADSSPATTFCLPAKKRVWAFHPDLVPGKPLSLFDLNVEYKPLLIEENKEIPLAIESHCDEIEEKKNKNPLPISSNQSNVESHCEEKDEKRKKKFLAVSTNQCNYESQFEEKDEKKKKNPLTVRAKESNIESCCEEKEEKKLSVVDGNVKLIEITEKMSEDEKIEAGDCEEDDGILCAICESTDGDPSDPIVFCDGCDLMVHATCYGNPLNKGVPEGDWFCAQCLIAQSDKPNKPFSCCLCPSNGGAMKPTKDGSWAHVVCALFVPEVFFEDPDGREGIDCSKVPKRRWEEKCYLCNSRPGCVIQCSEPKCSLAFHVTCGLDEDLCIEYNEGKKKKETIVAGFCKCHTELWKKQQQTGKFKIVARE